MSNPFAISSEAKRQYATIAEDGHQSKIYLTKAEEDSIYMARKAKEPFVYLQGHEYPTNRIRLHAITDLDRVPNNLRWVEDGAHGVQFVDGQERRIWIFRAFEGIPTTAQRLVETYLGYFNDRGTVVRITNPA